MKTKELIQYLQEFDPETEMSILAVDPPRRLRFPVGGGMIITDQGFPVICIELDGEEPFDEEKTAAAEADEAGAAKGESNESTSV